MNNSNNRDLIGWLNCECFFSLILVALLAALPFNLHPTEMYQTRDTFVSRAEEYFSEGAFSKAVTFYKRAIEAEETAIGHIYLAEALTHAKTQEFLDHLTLDRLQD